jgi:hypothetical protein
MKMIKSNTLNAIGNSASDSKDFAAEWKQNQQEIENIKHDLSLVRHELAKNHEDLTQTRRRLAEADRLIANFVKNVGSDEGKTNFGFLHRYFLNNPGKRLHKWTHYFDIYERHFERFRGRQPVVLEIGVMGGGSLEMWRAYFGVGCKIIGIDVNPTCKQHEADGIEVFIGSQDDHSVINAVAANYPQIDIAIDDGSHRSPHMIDSFNLLYHRVSPNGVYLVEDTHTNYWPDYEGGLNKSGTFIEFCKSKADEIGAATSRGALELTPFTTSTDSITFYDSVVVFEKRPQSSRQAPVTRSMGAQA